MKRANPDPDGRPGGRRPHHRDRRPARARNGFRSCGGRGGAEGQRQARQAAARGTGSDRGQELPGGVHAAGCGGRHGAEDRLRLVHDRRVALVRAGADEGLRRRGRFADARGQCRLRSGHRPAPTLQGTDAAQLRVEGVPQGDRVGQKGARTRAGQQGGRTADGAFAVPAEGLRRRAHLDRHHSSPPAPSPTSSCCSSTCAAVPSSTTVPARCAASRCWCATTRPPSTGKTCSTTSCTRPRQIATCARCTG